MCYKVADTLTICGRLFFDSELVKKYISNSRSYLDKKKLKAKSSLTEHDTDIQKTWGVIYFKTRSQKLKHSEYCATSYVYSSSK